MKEQLLLHQLVTGLPHEVSKQLRAAGVKTLPEAVERAKVLMTVEQHPSAAPVAAAQPKLTELLQLQKQISELSAQVAALTTQQAFNRKSQPLGDGRPTRCFICVSYAINLVTCSIIAHLAKTIDTASLVANQDMDESTGLRETTGGRLPGAAVVPAISKPTGHCGYSEKQCHSDNRGGRKGNC